MTLKGQSSMSWQGSFGLARTKHFHILVDTSWDTRSDNQYKLEKLRQRNRSMNTVTDQESPI